MKQTFGIEARPSAADRLLDAAEALFADHGIQATSIRDITTRAGANLASVHYHFRSKEGLLRAVLARRADPVNVERFRLLEECIAAAAPGHPPVEAVLRAFIQPTGELFERHRPFLRFAARLWSESDADLRLVLFEQFSGMAKRFVEALRGSAPHLGERELWGRFSFSVGAMLHTWTFHDDLVGFAGLQPGSSPATLVMEEWIRFCAAGFRAPGEGGNP